MVNGGPVARPLRVELSGANKVSRQALKIVLAGEASAVNSFDDPTGAAPVTSAVQVGRQFEYEAPAHSLTLIRIKTR